MLFSILYYTPQTKRYFRSSVILSDVSGELAAVRFAKTHYQYFAERKLFKHIPSDWKPGRTTRLWYADNEQAKDVRGAIFETPPDCYKPIDICVELEFFPLKGGSNGKGGEKRVF